MVLHRWDYDSGKRVSECVPLPKFGVESHQWCIGCGCIISDLELSQRGFPRAYPRGGAYLDIIATSKGYEPIEADSDEAYRFLRRKKMNGGTLNVAR